MLSSKGQFKICIVEVVVLHVVKYILFPFLMVVQPKFNEEFKQIFIPVSVYYPRSFSILDEKNVLSGHF